MKREELRREIKEAVEFVAECGYPVHKCVDIHEGYISLYEAVAEVLDASEIEYEEKELKRELQALIDEMVEKREELREELRKILKSLEEQGYQISKVTNIHEGRISLYETVVEILDKSEFEYEVKELERELQALIDEMLEMKKEFRRKLKDILNFLEEIRHPIFKVKDVHERYILLCETVAEALNESGIEYKEEELREELKALIDSH